MIIIFWSDFTIFEVSVFGWGSVFGAAESLAKLSSVLNETNVSDIGDELGKYQGCIVDSSRVDYYEYCVCLEYLHCLLQTR